MGRLASGEQLIENPAAERPTGTADGGIDYDQVLIVGHRGASKQCGVTAVRREPHGHGRGRKQAPYGPGTRRSRHPELICSPARGSYPRGKLGTPTNRAHADRASPQSATMSRAQLRHRGGESRDGDGRGRGRHPSSRRPRSSGARRPPTRAPRRAQAVTLWPSISWRPRRGGAGKPM